MAMSLLRAYTGAATWSYMIAHILEYITGPGGWPRTVGHNN